MNNEYKRPLPSSVAALKIYHADDSDPKKPFLRRLKNKIKACLKWG